MKHYNKVLGEQLAELKMEIRHVKLRFRMDFSLGPPGPVPDPRKLGRTIERNSKALRAELAEQRRDFNMLTDAAATKRWLKGQRELMEFDLDFDFF